MRCKFKSILAIACVTFFSFSFVAPSQAAPKSTAAQKHVAKKNSKAKKLGRVAHASKTKTADVKPMRAFTFRVRDDDDSGALKSYSPVARAIRARPAFGWPALITEARKYVGTNPTRRTKLWCATFMNFVLAKVGYAGTGSDAAKSFASYGKRISEPRVGAIAVLTRGNKGGHVGIVTGLDANGNPIILSGNHNRTVGEGTYSRSRVIAYVMPTDQPQLARASSGSSASDASGESLASPITELLAAINAESPREERREPQAAPAPERVAQQAPVTPSVRSRMVEQTTQQAVIPRPPEAIPTATIMAARADTSGRPARAKSAPAVDIFGRPMLTR